VTLEFPVTRTGDLGYEAILNYHTVDGTALAGTDYTATNGSIVIPAGTSNAMIPVALLPNASSSANRQFQMVLDSAVGIGPTPSFAAPQAFSTGANAMSVAAADLNGDGKPDLIVGNVNGSSVSVLLNTTVPGAAAPSFTTTQQTFVTGTSPISVQAVDVNGDGEPDLAIANFADNTVSVLINTTAPGASTPSFTSQQTFVTGNSPRSLISTDLNGDGKPDLVVENAGDNTVSVLFNTAATGATAASFATQQTFSTGAGSFFLTTGDINSDGKPDLIVVNNSGVAVLLNTMAPGAFTGSFNAQHTFATGSSPWAAAAADVNGDGKADLIVTNYNDNTVSVLLNITASGATVPSFAAQQIFPVGSGPRSVAAADVNGDGKPDLIVTNSIGGSVSILLNTNVPGANLLRFAPAVTFASGQIPNAVSVADVNGDGKPDLVVANQGTNTVSVLLNTTATGDASVPSFAAQQQFTDANLNAVTAADVNGDGKPDLIMANSGNNTVSVLPNTTPPGAVSTSFATMQNFGTGNGTDSVTTADVNGDGKRDIIVANSSDGTVSVLLNTAAPGVSIPTFATQQTFSAGIEPNNVTAADLNGDGRPDIVVTDDLQHTVVVLLNTTAPGNTLLSFTPQQAFLSGSNRPNSVAIADVNGDGKSDLIMATQGNDSNNISVLLNTTAPGATTPSFAAAQTFATGSGNPNFITTADINGDGKSDLVATNGGNAVSLLLNTTAPGTMTLSFAAAQSFSTPNGPSSVSAVDIDGDGRPDLIVSNSAFAIPSNTVSVLLNTTAPGASAPSFATQQAFATGEYPHSAIATDINSDGKPDIVVANTGSGTISVLINRQYQAEVFGSPATGTIVHDYIFADGFGP
jgi:hypothetical protein